MGFCPCDTCQTVHFKVTDDTGDQMTMLDKRTAGCLKSALTSADNFQAEFSQHARDVDRALLLGAIIFMDYMWFEKRCC